MSFVVIYFGFRCTFNIPPLMTFLIAGFFSEDRTNIRSPCPCKRNTAQRSPLRQNPRHTVLTASPVHIIHALKDVNLQVNRKGFDGCVALILVIRGDRWSRWESAQEPLGLGPGRAEQAPVRLGCPRARG